jgi:fatty acid desaturase
MHGTITRFKTRPYFLLGYFTIQFLVFCAIVALQVHFTDLTRMFSAPFSFWGLALLPLGLIVGIQVPVLMHNCVHSNLRPRWLNRVCGELAGVYIMLGMEAFALNHYMHHGYSDSDLDPHNPENKKFLGFFFANNFGGTVPVRRKYVEYHGDTPRNHAVFTAILFMHFLNVPIRIAFWLLLLGPSLFVTAFVPSYLFHMFVFSHINYVTHATLPDGKAEIYNLDSNLYYKLVNFFGAGVYYHKNHHRNPTHFNPMRGASKFWLVR